jgi:dinuclear metal center YbgI/SA1388 family protein
MLTEPMDARMAELKAILAYTDELLQTGRFQDYCPNGLQVEGSAQVNRIATGVTASQAFIEQALADGAGLLVVHHGFFWRGEDSRLIGIKAHRIGALFRSGASLAAYHLPLDAHLEIGNNAGIAVELELSIEGRFGPADIAMYGETAQPLTGEAFSGLVSHRFGRHPVHIPAPRRPIRRVGWCSGAAQDYIEQAHALGLDAYISGEISERTVHLARELGIHYFAAGHHATERWGVKTLGERLADKFQVEHTFIDVPNPV